MAIQFKTGFAVCEKRLTPYRAFRVMSAPLVLRQPPSRPLSGASVRERQAVNREP